MTRPHEIQPGTVLNYAAPYDVPSQLPWNCPSEGWLVDNVYEGLLYMYMNDPEDIRGCIAESWTHSDDYLTWTFQIRDGIKFTDGTVCDAYAIAKAWNHTYEMGHTYITKNNISSWEAKSEKEFVVQLSTPCAYFEIALCGDYLLVASPCALALYGTDDNRAAVGTGPYYIDSYTSGVSIVLKASQNYYLKEKMPCIETVNFWIFREQEAIERALLIGDIDSGNISNLESYYSLQKKGYDGKLVQTIGNSAPLWFNAKKVEAFQTHEVREAICRFIDFNEINNELYDGRGLVQDGIWAKGSSGYVQTDQFYYDPDEGQELLASVGLEPSDIKFEVIYSDYNKDMYLAIHNKLTKFGVRIDLEQLDPKYNLMPEFHGDWSIYYSSVMGYSNVTPYSPWTFILKPDARIKLCWQDIYDPELYEKMLDEYDAIHTATTWDYMLTRCKQLTIYVQDDFGAIGSVQPPEFMVLSKVFKNGIYFSERHDIQLYYLYQ